MIINYKNGIPLEVSGHKVEEYFFFINSVTAIRNIIENAGLTNEDVKVICSNSPKNRAILGNIDISTVDGDGKPFIFCTKTVFYGADFKSESGLIIIVSECRNKNTMLDIATDIQQISGRIRNANNPFKNIIFHIFNTGISNMTKEQFEVYLAERIESAQEIIKLYEASGRPKARKAILERINPEDKDELAYFDNASQSFKMNDIKVLHMRYKFESVTDVYKNGLSIREAYAKLGWDITDSQQWEYIIDEFIEKVKRTPKFITLYDEYCIERSNISIGRTERAKTIEEMNPYIPLAYEYLSHTEVERTCSKISLLKNLVNSRRPAAKSAIEEFLSKSLTIGNSYSRFEIKETLKKAWLEIGLEGNPKATDIVDFFEIKNGIKVYRKGKRVDGIQIIDAKNKMAKTMTNN